jgi:hypothetical protein
MTTYKITRTSEDGSSPKIRHYVDGDLERLYAFSKEITKTDAIRHCCDDGSLGIPVEAYMLDDNCLRFERNEAFINVSSEDMRIKHSAAVTAKELLDWYIELANVVGQHFSVKYPAVNEVAMVTR